MKNYFKYYKKLFFTTLLLSAFTFGGGYVIVSMIKNKFVDKYHWIKEKEMLDIIAISQSAPGPIAVDASVLVGYRLAGVPGAMIALCATVLPSLIILSIVFLFYEAFKTNLFVIAALKGMQAGITALIADVVISGVSTIFKSKGVFSIAVMFASFVAAYFLHINVVYIILFCSILGCLQF